ncbi:PTS fructose transporter subunit IIC [Traorella massiliensis]|uniref:PTS fructose transporter subunit IIC n=1 Tax=Traorella massiliensis TaxID=1903263 RepID=UPI0023535131|nr:PTS fructose transporter subunit IIC [Traorella massiliensis]
MKQQLTMVKKHVMTGISFMIPLVVGAGLCMAISIIIGGPNVSTAEGTFAYTVNRIGSLGMTLVVPVITAAIAYSISDRPGVAPGLIIGLICTEIKAGFIGGIVGAFLVGYFVNWLKKLLRNVPESIKGLVPILLIPLISTFVCGLLMFYVVGQPIVAFMDALTNFLMSMQSGSKFVFGFLVSGLAGTDFGGPINKSVSLFANGLMVDGILEPEACKLLGCMIPPMGIIVAYILARKKFTKAEKEAVKACLPMGICMITECVIPLAMNDLWRVVLSSVIGCGVAGGLSMLMGVGASVPHGGWFVIPTFQNPVGYVICMIVGSLIMGVLLAVLKRPLKEDEDSLDSLGTSSGKAAVNLDDIKIEEIG